MRESESSEFRGDDATETRLDLDGDSTPWKPQNQLDKSRCVANSRLSNPKAPFT